MKIDLIIETNKAMKSITSVQEALSALSKTDFSTFQGVYKTVQEAQRSFAKNTNEVANTVKDSLNNISDFSRNQLRVQTEQYENARKAEVEIERKTALQKLKEARDFAKAKIENEKQLRKELEQKITGKQSGLDYEPLIKKLEESAKKAYSKWEDSYDSKNAIDYVKKYTEALKNLDNVRRVAGKKYESYPYKEADWHFDSLDVNEDKNAKPFDDYKKQRKDLYKKKPSQDEIDTVNSLASKYTQKTSLDKDSQKAIDNEVKQLKKEYTEAEKAYQHALIKAKMGEEVLSSIADVQEKRNKAMAKIRSLQKKENLSEDERASLVANKKLLERYASSTSSMFYNSMSAEDVIKDAKAFRSKLNAKSKRDPEIQDENLKTSVNAEINKAILGAEIRLSKIKKEQEKAKLENEAKQKTVEKQNTVSDKEQELVKPILSVNNAWLTVAKTIDSAVIAKINKVSEQITKLKEALKSLDSQVKPSKVKEVAEKSPVTSEENTKIKPQDINDVRLLAGAWDKVGSSIKENVINNIALMRQNLTPIQEALGNINSLLKEADSEIQKSKNTKKDKKDDKEVDKTKEKLEKLDGALSPVSVRLAKMAEDANLLLERLSKASNINFAELKNAFKEVNQAAATLKKYGTKVVEKSQKEKEKREKQEDTPDKIDTLNQQRKNLLHKLETSYAENHQNSLDKEWIANLQKVRDLTSEIMTMRRMMGQAPQGLRELNSLINSYGKEEQPQIRRSLLQEYGNQKAEQILIDKEKKSAVDSVLQATQPKEEKPKKEKAVNQRDKEESQREKTLQYEQRVRYALDNNQSKEESQREKALQYEQRVRYAVNNKQNKEYGQIDREIEKIENKLLDLQSSVYDHSGKDGLVYSQNAYLKDLRRLFKIKNEIEKLNAKTNGNFFEGRTDSVYKSLTLANVKDKKAEINEKESKKLMSLLGKVDVFEDKVNSHKGKDGFEYTEQGLFNAKQQFKKLQKEFEKLSNETSLPKFSLNKDIFNGVNVKNPKAKTKEALTQKVSDFEQDVNSYKGEDGFEYTKRGLYNAKKKLKNLQREWETLAQSQEMPTFPLSEKIFEGVNRKAISPKTQNTEVIKTNTLIKEQIQLIIAMRDAWSKTNGEIANSDEWKRKLAQLSLYSQKITQMKLAMNDIAGARSSLKKSLYLAGDNSQMTNSLLSSLYQIERESQRVKTIIQQVKDSLKTDTKIEVFDEEKETKKLNALKAKLDNINNRFTDSIDEKKPLSLRQYRENARKGLIVANEYNNQARKFNEHGYDVMPTAPINQDTTGSNYQNYRFPIDAKNRVQELEKAYDKLIKKLEIFKGIDGEVISDRSFKEAKLRIEEIAKEYEKLSSQIGENKKLDTNVFDKVNRKPLSQEDVQSIQSLSSKITEATERTSNLYTKFEKTKALSDKIKFEASLMGLEKLRKEEDKLNKALGRTESLVDKIADSFKTRMKWAITGNIADNVSNLVDSSFHAFMDLEKTMAGVQQVMPFIEGNQKRTTDESLNLINISREYAQNPLDVANAARLWGRGYGKSYINNIVSNSIKNSENNDKDNNIDDIKVSIDGVNQSVKEYIKDSMATKTTNELARQSAMLAAVDNFSLEESVKGLESVLSAYEHRATSDVEAAIFANRAVDIITKVSHMGQISAQDLVQGIEATGKAAQQAGVSLSFLSSMIETGVRNTGRSGSEIGQAIKALTVGVHSKKGIKELANFGIDVSEVGEDGVRKLRPLQSVILDIATALEKGDKNAENMIMAIAGGRYQYSKLASILNDKDELLRQWGEAINSNGFAKKQLEIQLNTIDSKLKQIKASATQLIQVIMSGGGINGIKVVLDAINKALQNISTHVDGLEKIALVVGGYFGLKQISPFLKNIGLAVKNVKEYKKALEELQLHESKRSLLGSVSKEMLNKVNPLHSDEWEAPKKNDKNAKEKSEATIRHEELQRQSLKSAEATKQFNKATLTTVDASNKASKAQKGQAVATKALATAETVAKGTTNALTISELRMVAVTTAATMGLNLIIGAVVSATAYWAVCTNGLEEMEDRIESITGLTKEEADSNQERLETLKTEISQRKEQIDYADKAIVVLREHKKASEDSTLSEEKQKEAKEKLQQVETDLSMVFSKDAIKRMKEAGWTSEAYKKEKDTFIKTTSEKEEEINTLNKGLIEYYKNRNTETIEEVQRLQTSLENFKEWTVGQIEGLNILQSAYAWFYKWKYDRATAAVKRDTELLENYKSELEELTSKDDLTEQESKKKTLLERDIDVIQGRIEDYQKDARNYKREATETLQKKIDEVIKQNKEARAGMISLSGIEQGNENLFASQQPQGEWGQEDTSNKGSSGSSSNSHGKTVFAYDTEQIQAISNLQQTLKEKYNDKGLDMGSLISIAQRLTGNGNLNLSGSSDIFRNASADAWDSAWVFFEQMTDMFEQGKGSAEALAKIYKDISKDEWNTVLNNTELRDSYDFNKNQRDFTDPHNQELVYANNEAGKSDQFMWKMALRASQKTGVNPDFIYGQFMYETGGSGNQIAMTNHNYAGLGGGQGVDWISDEAFLQEYSKTLNNGSSLDGITYKNAKTATEFVNILKANGYFADSNVAGYIKSVDYYGNEGKGTPISDSLSSFDKIMDENGLTNFEAGINGCVRSALQAGSYISSYFKDLFNSNFDNVDNLYNRAVSDMQNGKNITLESYSDSKAKTGDIVLYVDQKGERQHAGLIAGTDENGRVINYDDATTQGYKFYRRGVHELGNNRIPAYLIRDNNALNLGTDNIQRNIVHRWAGTSKNTIGFERNFTAEYIDQVAKDKEAYEATKQRLELELKLTGLTESLAKRMDENDALYYESTIKQKEFLNNSLNSTKDRISNFIKSHGALDSTIGNNFYKLTDSEQTSLAEKYKNDEFKKLVQNYQSLMKSAKEANKTFEQAENDRRFRNGHLAPKEQLDLNIARNDRWAKKQPERKVEFAQDNVKLAERYTNSTIDTYIGLKAKDAETIAQKTEELKRYETDLTNTIIKQKEAKENEKESYVKSINEIKEKIKSLKDDISDLTNGSKETQEAEKTMNEAKDNLEELKNKAREVAEEYAKAGAEIATDFFDKMLLQGSQLKDVLKEIRDEIAKIALKRMVFTMFGVKNSPINEAGNIGTILGGLDQRIGKRKKKSAGGYKSNYQLADNPFNSPYSPIGSMVGDIGSKLFKYSGVKSGSADYNQKFKELGSKLQINSQALTKSAGIQQTISTALPLLETAETTSKVADTVNTTSITANTAALTANTAALQASSFLRRGITGNATGGLVGFATGGNTNGLIKGAGTGTSDSILTYLAHRGQFIKTSNGEYIIKKSTVDKVGVPFLDTLNNNPEAMAGLQRYADGGSLGEEYVPTMSNKTVANYNNFNKNKAESKQISTKRMENLLQGLRNDVQAGQNQSQITTQPIILNTQADSNSVMKAIAKNPRALQNILGGQKKRGFR